MKVRTKSEVGSFTHSSDNSGYLQTLGSTPGRPTLFSRKFLMGYCLDGPLGSARAESLSYSAVKLFSKYSNLWCDHGTRT